MTALQTNFSTGTCVVDLQKLASNIHAISAHISSQNGSKPHILLPVKSNAYGHGMIEVSRFVEKNGLVDYLGVAHLVEAYELRESGIKLPILIMGQIPLDADGLEYCIQNNIEVCASSIELIAKLGAIGQTIGKPAIIHLDIDTGMGRTGFLHDDILSFERIKKFQKGIQYKGIMTHFSVADSSKEEDISFTQEQVFRFETCKSQILKLLNQSYILTHVSNSGGIAFHPNMKFDMIRPGIASYGYSEKAEEIGLRPVMEVRSKITLIKSFPPHAPIGYGRTYIAKQSERLGIIPLGYGDGLFRSLSGKLTPILNGTKTICVGRISMDQCMIRVDDSTKVGDEVIIIGTSGSSSITASDIAMQANTISYEVLCALGNGKRITHVYVG